MEHSFGNDHYWTLDVEATASQAQIDASYLRLSSSPQNCWQRFTLWLSGRTAASVDEAFSVLRDPARRQAYDRQRRALDRLTPYPPI